MGKEELSMNSLGERVRSGILAHHRMQNNPTTGSSEVKEGVGCESLMSATQNLDNTGFRISGKNKRYPQVL